MPRASILFACNLLSATTLGCGPGERPPPAGDGTTAAYLSSAPDPAHTVREPLVDESGMPALACEPRSTRECRFYFTDERGQQHCPMSSQICQEDGKDWLPCGQREPDQDGQPVRPR